MKDFNVLVSMVLPKFEGIFAVNIDIHAATSVVGFSAVRKPLRIIADGYEAVSQKSLLAWGKLFKKLNDFIVNEETVVHYHLPDNPRR
jgi:hypothetical protein